MEQMDWVTTPQKALGPVTRIQTSAQTTQPQDSRHNIRRGHQKIVHPWLDMTGITYQERYIHRFGIRRILRIIRELATHCFTMVGSKDHNRILIQTLLFQCFKDLSESTVYTGNRGKVVANALCFFTLLICIGTDKKAVQRLIFVQIEIFFHTIIQ